MLIVATYKNPSLRIKSFAIMNLRVAFTKLNLYIDVNHASIYKLNYHNIIVQTCGHQAFPAEFLKNSTKVNEITIC